MADGAQDFSGEEVRKWFDKVRPIEPDFEGKMKSVVGLVGEGWRAGYFADAFVSPFSLFSSSVGVLTFSEPGFLRAVGALGHRHAFCRQGFFQKVTDEVS